MKKLLLLVCAAVMSLSASAQAGDKALGAQFVFGSQTNNIGFGVKGQYYVTDHLRGEASFDYFFKNKGLTMWDINANAHYLINVADKFNVYPLAGIGYTNWSYRNYVRVKNEPNGPNSTEEVKGTDGRIAINLGGGVEYAVTDNIILNAEMKYQIISNYNQLVLGVGVAYKF